MKLAAALTALFVMAAGGAAAADAPAVEAWWRGYLAAPSVRTPDGRKLRVYCLGAGGPAVVMESGLGGGPYGFRRVQPQISRTSRVCIYDRAGYGGSDEAKDARDLEALAADLAVVVKVAGQGRPVVLVGHSFGGPITRYFAFRHPQLVAGLLLIDPSGDDQNARFAAAFPGLPKLDAASSEVRRSCIAMLEGAWPALGSTDYQRCVGTPPADAPAELAQAAMRERGPAFNRAAQAELASFQSGLDAKQAAAARRSLGETPLIVLTRGDPVTQPGLTDAEQASLDQIWRTMHWETAQLAAHGRRRFVEGAGHNIQMDKPDVVIAAVVEVVTEARGRRR